MTGFGILKHGARLPNSETAGLRDCRTPKRPKSETPRPPNSETAELREGPDSDGMLGHEMGAAAVPRCHMRRSSGLYWRMPPRGTLRVIDAAEDFAVDVNRCFGPPRSLFYADQA